MAQRDDVPDLQRVLPDYDPLDQQLQDPLTLREGRHVEPGSHPTAEFLQVRPDLLRRLTLDLQPLFLVALGDQDLASASDLIAAGLQLLQVDHLGLVGVD
ncbi:hypothetical protein EP7_001971 [Isosphaeraceae bacterium EP7]